MENSLIRVDDVETAYSEASGSFPGFRKVIDPEEVGDRLDEGVGILKEILVTVKDGFRDLGGKMDTMLDKQDSMLDKQDSMLDKQDSIVSEIQGLRFDMNSYMNQRFERIESDLAELKAAMRERGII
ncbi:MAG: hypothetical protein NUK54_07550 [Methanothrix sp.]|nr:hypothetical protein [Methanothrix sp.]